MNDKERAEPTMAQAFALLVTQQVARVQEAERHRRAELVRVIEGVNRAADEMGKIHASALGKKAEGLATAHERLALGHLSTRIHRALVRGFSEHHRGRDVEAKKAFDEYDRHMADSTWLWNLLLERARTGVNNRHLSDHYILPGAVETRVEEVDAQGKPLRLLRVMG